MDSLGLLAVQIALTLAGFAAGYWLFRSRYQSLRAEMARLQRAYDALLAERLAARRPPPQAARPALVAAQEAAPPARQEPPPQGAQIETYPLRLPRRAPAPLRPPPKPAAPAPSRPAEPPHDPVRLLLAIGPFLTPLPLLILKVGPEWLTALVLALSLGALALSLRKGWELAAWAAPAGLGAWTVASLALGAAAAHPAVTAAALFAASAAGLVYALRRRRQPWPGAALALAAALGALALSAEAGVIGPAGLAAGGAIALAAIIGAARQQLEPMHLAAFAGAVLGLYLLSGQESAAFWFTPAAAWAGALFLAIAAVRAPILGARGAVLAATGAIAPILAASSLHAARHGLDDPLVAAAAFFALGAVLIGLLALAAHKAAKLQELGLTTWAFAVGGLGAAAIGAAMLGPPVVTAPAFAALALCAAAADTRAPLRVWRFAALAIGAAAAVSAAVAAAGAHDEYARLHPVLAILLALIIPSACALYAAYLMGTRAPMSATLFEGAAILGAAATLSALAVWAFASPAAGAALSFAEVGLHAGLWLALALGVAWRMDRGAQALRQLAALGLAAAALLAVLWGGAIALNPWWGPSPAAAQGWPVLNLLAAGFALPAIGAWAHWAFWRARGARARPLIFFIAAVLLTALWLILEARRGFAGPMLASAPVGWGETALYALIAAAAGAAMLAAISRRLSPGADQLDLEEYLKRNRRGQVRH